ncbi:MAG: hypothetical protein KME31_29750 [Tolypothrix carrinoi HA7290-LM1]|jgi:hypothetical protein|nr:hypothetical protein [Tolypothrix carrinoi HA7290-LM1]
MKIRGLPDWSMYKNGIETIAVVHTQPVADVFVAQLAFKKEKQVDRN